MSIVTIPTTLGYSTDNYKYYLIANDTVATQIRGNSFNTITVNPCTSALEFWETLSNYIGDINDISIPYASSFDDDYATLYNYFIEAFPNAFEVMSNNPAVKQTDWCHFGTKDADAISEGSAIRMYVKATSVSSYSVTPLMHFTSHTFGQLQILIPIFKEAEIAGGKINHISDTRFSWLRIIWQPNNQYAPYLQIEGYRSSSENYMNYFENAVIPDPPSPPSTDPYNGGGYSGTGGGPGTGGQTGTGGNYDTSSDPIPIPNPPSDIATGTGLFSAFNPTANQLASLASALWNKDPSTFDDWWRYFFGGDAFNAIIGLTMIPVEPSKSSPTEIYLGKWGTGVSAPKITNQYKQVNFGSVTLSEFWGNAIDYSPYTRVQLALPYIGIVEVDTDDVIGSVNTLTYNIDVFSGAISAMLHCVKGNLSSVIYQWSGSCAVQLPTTGASFNAVMGAVTGIAAGVGAIAVGAATIATGGTAGAVVGGIGTTIAGTVATTGSAANTFGSIKGKVQKSGGFGACSGALGIMTPYFIITRPVQSVPSTQQTTKGYPANISAHLGDLTGYTELIEVHLHDIPGTKDEVLEIETLLKKGVIF